MGDDIVINKIFLDIDIIKSHAASWLIRLSNHDSPINIEEAILDIHFSLSPFFNDGIYLNIMKKFNNPNEIFTFIKEFFMKDKFFKEILAANNIEFNNFIFNMTRTLINEIMHDSLSMEVVKNNNQITIQ